jgi:hypothetical protein
MQVWAVKWHNIHIDRMKIEGVVVAKEKYTDK